MVLDRVSFRARSMKLLDLSILISLDRQRRILIPRPPGERLCGRAREGKDDDVVGRPFVRSLGGEICREANLRQIIGTAQQKP
ncbi:hypothetical protein NDU88_002797 [Pleurodeles waltl]|uniref:Uncharacterized protein n=1 Tax=Pleurodeles waltl TaxID=8319 RepID=A0AAV7VEA7_PLEWA|nr:hypothetical protein NDU88_002797 [Pleurodeles waltl]